MTETIFKDVIAQDAWVLAYDAGVSGIRNIRGIKFVNNSTDSTHSYAITTTNTAPTADDYQVKIDEDLLDFAEYKGEEKLSGTQCFWVRSGNSNTTVIVSADVVR